MMDQYFHSPQHPLPEEIQSMKKDDTVCKFCGISYLIHREVKRLQDELNICKDKLKHLENAAEREEIAKAETKLLQDKFSELSQSAAKTKDEYESAQQEKEMILLSMTNIDNENRNLKHQLIEMKELATKAGKGKKERGKLLKTYKSTIKELRRDYNATKESTVELKETMESKIMDMKFCVSGIIEKTAKEKKQLLEEIKNNNKTHAEVDGMLSAKDETIAKLNHANNEMKIDIQDHMTAVKQLLKDNKLLKEKNTKLNSLIEKKNVELKNQETDFDNKKSNLSNELSSLKRTISSLNCEIATQSARITKQSEDSKKLEDENLKFRIAQSDAEKDTTNYIEELKAASLSSKIANEELKRLKSQRQKDIEMHQEQLREMRDSYKSKLINASDELKDLDAKHKNEISVLKQSLRDEAEELKIKNEKGISDQKQLYEDRLRLTTNEMKTKMNQIVSERDSIEKRMIKERQRLQSLHECEQKKSKDLLFQHESEVNDLKLKVDLLQKERSNSLSLGSSRKKFEESTRALALANDEISRMEKVKLGLENKIEQLQETVRRECEERLELTQSLCDARMEVLELQRKQQLPVPNNRISYSGTSSNSSSSSKSPRKLSRPQKSKGISYTEIKKRLSTP